jgi:hypothetical protein
MIREATVPLESEEEHPIDTMAKNKKRRQNRKFSLRWPRGKKEWVLLVVALLIIVVGTLFILNHKPKQSVFAFIKQPLTSSKPSTVASPLTGVQVAPALAKLPVTAIMIENSDAARPQSGLSSAGVVYEALVEGGITRFMALYQEGEPTSIGPIRSARPIFIDAALPFDAPYAHVGGSPDALSEIQSENVKDMNQFYNGSSYTRISSREAPHNVYTSMTSLHTLEQSKGWTSSSFTSFPRKSDSPSKAPNATTIALNISSADYNVQYQYVPSQNSYLRSEAGAPMVDSNTGKQLEPKVVIAIVVPWTRGALDASDAYYTDYSDIGTGSAYIFQDGTVTKGVWMKSSITSQIQFQTSTGSALRLNAGQTWITAVGTASEVTYGT